MTQRSICPATHSPPGRELPGAVSFTLLSERATCWPAEDEPDRSGHPGRSQQLFFARLALAGRSEPPLRVARLRAEGRILEIGPGDLSLTCEEAASLLRDAEVALGEDEVAGLHRRTEGWPAGLYLAALYLREGGPLASAAVSFGGDDRLVSEYMESEFLARISRRQRVFLTRTAVLERMSGPLCEAVLDVRGSAATLTDLAQSNLLLVPLDRRGEWYRYHHLFRDMLLAELQRLEPELIPVLRRRAAGWYVQNGLPEEALEYSIAAGDIDAAAGLVEKLVVSAHRRGRVPTVQRWLRWLEERGGFEGHPMAAVLAALFCALTGRPVEAERWADVVDRWQYGDPGRPGDPSTEAWAAVMRTFLCRSGVERMSADADEAVRRFAAESLRARVRTRSLTCCWRSPRWPGSAGSSAPLPIWQPGSGMTSRPRWRNRTVADGSPAGRVDLSRDGGGTGISNGRGDAARVAEE